MVTADTRSRQVSPIAVTSRTLAADGRRDQSAPRCPAPVVPARSASPTVTQLRPGPAWAGPGATGRHGAGVMHRYGPGGTGPGPAPPGTGPVARIGACNC